MITKRRRLEDQEEEEEEAEECVGVSTKILSSNQSDCKLDVLCNNCALAVVERTSTKRRGCMLENIRGLLAIN